jgi:hypothetical protein
MISMEYKLRLNKKLMKNLMRIVFKIKSRSRQELRKQAVIKMSRLKKSYSKKIEKLKFEHELGE